jgi:hypothetical protein
MPIPTGTVIALFITAPPPPETVMPFIGIFIEP